MESCWVQATRASLQHARRCFRDTVNYLQTQGSIATGTTDLAVFLSQANALLRGSVTLEYDSLKEFFEDTIQIQSPPVLPVRFPCLCGGSCHRTGAEP